MNAIVVADQRWAIGQDRLPPGQGAHLLIGGPGQGQGGVQLGRPLQVVQNGGVDRLVLLAP